MLSRPPSTDDLASTHDQLSRRCTLFLLAAMSLALGMGLIAWGPVLFHARPVVPAGDAERASLLHALNASASGVTLIAGLLALWAIRRSHWPSEVRHPWAICLGFVVLSSALSMAYHTWPRDTLFVLGNAAGAGGFLLLLCGFLAERVHPLFGSPRACLAAIALMLLAGLYCALSTSGEGQVDVRPLVMLQLLPVLLIPAGALNLAGTITHRHDWLLMIGTYLVAQVADRLDDHLFDASGWINGHAVLHLGLALTVGWLGWLSYADARRAARSGDDEPLESGASQATTSFNTTF